MDTYKMYIFQGGACNGSKIRWTGWRAPTDVVTGCVGLRVLDVTTTELTRLFGYPSARGQGGGDELLRTAENAAQRPGSVRMRLDTRHDLVEARSLYAKHGYRETDAPEQRLYADHWFEKRLALSRQV